MGDTAIIIGVVAVVIVMAVLIAIAFAPDPTPPKSKGLLDVFGAVAPLLLAL